jgi:uncharacterized RDD family membrane protein YckC
MVDLDLPIRTGDEAIGPLSDFALANVDDTDPNGSDAPQAPHRGPSSRTTPSPDLPLFRREPDDDAPLVSLPVSPRAPMSVRKSAIARTSSGRPAEEPALDLEPAPSSSAMRSSATFLRNQSPAPRPAADGVVDDGAATGVGQTASAGVRLGGALIDLFLLGGIDAAILFLTLRFCGLQFAEIGRLPVVPFAAFIALLNGGYMAAFTAAGGQSIGKMAVGTKVVTMDEAAATDRVRLGQSVLRAAGFLVSVLPAGIGFLPALLGAERRAVHDRLAHTRVVKA